jgi:hypothetical protein
MTRKTIGIDYSLTTPAICVCNGDFGFKNCKFYYLTNVNKYSGDWIKEDTLGVRQEGKFNHWLINGRLHLPYTTQVQRHDQISNWAFDIVGDSIDNIFIEGYSYGSKGLVFNLAENMGILKYKLYKANKKFEVIVPGVIKKNATGKGNADKLKMYEQFVEHTGVDLMKIYEQKKLNNPVTDIVDSFYIAKAGYYGIKGKK